MAEDAFAFRTFVELVEGQVLASLAADHGDKIMAGDNIIVVELKGGRLCLGNKLLNILMGYRVVHRVRSHLGSILYHYMSFLEFKFNFLLISNNYI